MNIRCPMMCLHLGRKQNNQKIAKVSRMATEQLSLKHGLMVYYAILLPLKFEVNTKMGICAMLTLLRWLS